MTNADVEYYAEQFSLGYYNCTGTDTTSVLHIAVGTNDSAGFSSSTYSALGHDWANVIQAVQSGNSSQAVQSQVAVWAANDIESWYYPNSGFYVPASSPNAWVNGYSNVDPAVYVDFGSADGCSTTSYNNALCDFGYTQYDYWYYAWGAPPSYVTPEIYGQSNAQEWAEISLYATHYQNGMSFQGPFDEYDLNSGTVDASTAWTDLENALIGAGVNSGMVYSAEIHCSNATPSKPTGSC